MHGASIKFSVLLSQLTLVRPVPTYSDAPRRPLLHRAPKRTMAGVQPAPSLGRCVQQRRACATGGQPRERRPQQRSLINEGETCVTVRIFTQ